MTGQIRRLLQDGVARRQFLTYVAIGGNAYVVYLLLLNLLLAERVHLSLAATLAYFIATALHFGLNRWLNFRRFDRAVHDQARTFAIVILVQWLVTVTVVDVLTARGVSPSIAATIAVIINQPGGFVANRYLTFGIGIVPRMLGARRAPK